MGAAGAGKTAVGQELARDLDWRFVDGDDHHAPAAIAKMRRGIALTDDDRAPWLASLHASVAAALDRREGLVLACSALKARYRDALRGTRRTVRFVYLKADEPSLRRRLAERTGHFAGPALLLGQLAELEEPTDAVIVDATSPLTQIVEKIRNEFGL